VETDFQHLRLARVAQTLGCAFAVLLLLACGGGGGGGSGGGGEAASATPAQATSFSVSGTVVASQSSAADGDTNNFIAPSDDNNTAATAQSIANPVSLTGYVNVANQGPPGRSFGAGDPQDLYRVSLAANQNVSLFIAGDGVTDDLDLALYDATGNTIIAFSATATQFESLTAPATNEYLIAVTALSGASNYTLVLSQATSTSQAAAKPEYVLGEVVVTMRDEPGISLRDDDVERDMQAASLDIAAGEPHREMLVRAGDVRARAASFSALGMGHLIPCDLDSRDNPTNTQAAWDTERLVKVLARRPDVMATDLNYVREPSLTPNDPLFDRQWHYAQIAVPQAWDEIQPASGVVVAVLDTGIVSNHPDLMNMIAPGYDFISNAGTALDGNGIDPDPEDPGDQSPGGSSFHGTHVAGTIAAQTDNNEGVAGVAWNASVMPIRVLGFSGGTDYDLIQGIRYAAGLPNDSGSVPANPADVINMSLGGPGYSQGLQDAITEARAAGVIIVAAAGNSATNQPFYPAAMNGVVSVSAVTIANSVAPYSNYGGTIDVAAPGGDFAADLNGDSAPDGVLSSLATDASGPIVGGYGFLQGTSMAAPHVAGVAALMRSVNPMVTPSDFDTLLAGGTITRDLGVPGRDNFFGNGLIDAYQAVVAAADLDPNAPPPVPQPTLVVSPGALNFGVATNSTNIAVTNGGGGNLQVASTAVVTDDGNAWLAIMPQSVDAAGLGSYIVSVDRNLVPADGIYTGTVTIASAAANMVEVPVIVQVGSTLSSAGDAGFHYVLLIDVATRRVVARESMSANAGSYPFSFAGIAPGSYRIVAGTDADNDSFICDPGEACGAYPTQGLASDVVVGNSDVSGLNFVTGAMAGVSGAAAGATNGNGNSGGDPSQGVRLPN
jgi:serine protease